jgi:hypothetical protein
LKEETLHRTLWRTCLGRGYGPAIKQITEWCTMLWMWNVAMQHFSSEHSQDEVSS